MGEFGWAYVVGTMVQGVTGSVQTADAGRLSGSNTLVWDEYEGSGSLRLTGSLNVSGAINANELNINVTNRNVINLTATGSTHFGDSIDDIHEFTGSVTISSSSGPLKLEGVSSAPGASSNHYLALDSNNQVVLTASLPPGGGGLIHNYTNPADNRIITSVDANSINAESNLTFDGSNLNVTGYVTASLGISSSLGEFNSLTASVGRFTSQLTIGTDSIVITEDSISGVNTLTSNNVGGTIVTAPQPNITSLGTLTTLNVAGNVSASALQVNSSTDRVGIGRNDPVRKLEVLTTDPQLRLSYSDFEIFGTSDVFTDIYTNNSGYLIMSGTGQRVGIGTTSPTRMLDVGGNMRVSGNLEVTGTLSARVTDFVVSADTITFGDSRTDTLTFNAATASIPNNLNFASNLMVLDSSTSRIGIGVQYPDSKLEILGASNQLKISKDQSTAAVFDVKASGQMNITPTGTAISASSDLFVSGSTILGADETKTTIIAGPLTASVAVSSSQGQFTTLTASNGRIASFTDGTATITGGNISGVGTLTATQVAGQLTTAAQPNVTSLGTLTGLNVAGNVSASALYVNHATQKVGIGRNDPVRKLEVLTTDPQLRLSYTDFEIFGTSDIFTDIYTNANGYLIMSGTGGRVGIGTTTPKAMLDVSGNMNVSGNLTVTGSLHANVSEFIVSADNITFGKDATDTLIFNAASGTIMNGLNLDANTLVIDSHQNRVGVGVEAPSVKLHVESSGLDQLRLGHNSSVYTNIETQANGHLNIVPTGGFVSASSGLKISGSSFLGSDETNHTVVSGQLTASVGLSSSLGLFSTLSGSEITDGTATIKAGNISGVGTLTANYLAGEITTAAQPNVTSVGTLSSLTISGDLTVDTNTLKVDSSEDKVGIGVTDPQKKLEILDTSGQLRLTNARATGWPSASPLKATDIYTNSNGYAILSSSHARFGIQNTAPAATLDVNGSTILGGTLKITGLSTGAAISSKYLALDSSNNVVLTSSAVGTPEVRSRRQVTGNTTTTSGDYYIGVSASSDTTITLIDASSIVNGQTYTIKDERGNADTYVLKIRASGVQTIDGEPHIIIASPFGAVNLYTNGVDKYFIF